MRGYMVNNQVNNTSYFVVCQERYKKYRVVFVQQLIINVVKIKQNI
jgi:hypothetical protein